MGTFWGICDSEIPNQGCWLVKDMKIGIIVKMVLAAETREGAVPMAQKRLETGGHSDIRKGRGEEPNTAYNE
jgi:hypothetical protein